MEGVSIYIDMVFFVNYMMDFLLLSLLKEILGKDSGRRERYMGAAVGAAWACFAAVVPMPGVLALVGNFGAALGMVAVTFRERGIHTLLFSGLGLLFLAMLLSGLVTVLYGYTDFGYAMRLTGIPSWFLLPVLSGGMAAVLRVSRYFWRYQGTKRQLWQVTLKKGTKKLELIGFLDTGNRLYEPYGGRPVHLVSESCLGGFLAENDNFLYIPYRSVGNEGGLLQGFLADEMVLSRQGRQVHATKPVLAVSKEPFSSQEAYQMILHPDFLAMENPTGTHEEG